MGEARAAMFKEQVTKMGNDSQEKVEMCSQLQRERESLQYELGNIKHVLEDVVNTHAPVEEVQKWRSQAEIYRQQYEQAKSSSKGLDNHDDEQCHGEDPTAGCCTG